MIIFKYIRELLLYISITSFCSLVLADDTPVMRSLTSLEFEFNSINIIPKEGRRIRELCSDLMQATVEGAIVNLVGHADGVGSEQYNNSLSIERARAVQKFIINECNINRSSIVFSGVGEYQPLDSKHPLSSANRRVSIGLEGGRNGAPHPPSMSYLPLKPGPLAGAGEPGKQAPPGVGAPPGASTLPTVPMPTLTIPDTDASLSPPGTLTALYPEAGQQVREIASDPSTIPTPVPPPLTTPPLPDPSPTHLSVPAIEAWPANERPPAPIPARRTETPAERADPAHSSDVEVFAQQETKVMDSAKDSISEKLFGDLSWNMLVVSVLSILILICGVYIFMKIFSHAEKYARRYDPDDPRYGVQRTISLSLLDSSLQIIGLTFILPVLLVASVADKLTSEALTAVLGAIVGYIFGSASRAASTPELPPIAPPSLRQSAVEASSESSRA